MTTARATFIFFKICCRQVVLGQASHHFEGTLLLSNLVERPVIDGECQFNKTLSSKVKVLVNFTSGSRGAQAFH